VALLQANLILGGAVKIDEVLNGSNSPRDAASAVFASDRTCSSFIGWNVRTAANAIKNLHAVNSTTTDVGRFKA